VGLSSCGLVLFTFKGGFHEILLMWDSRVVENIKEYMGEFIVACSFRNIEDQFTWASASVYGPNSNCDEGFYGMHWLVRLVDGTY
jgi:hypothetical protein